MPFSISLSLIFTRLLNPLSIGLTLLIQTLIISIITGIISYSFWFSYILFLIFIGGILVLFIYVASLASNEYFKLSFKQITLLFILTIYISFITLLLDPLIVSFKTLLPTSSVSEILSTPKIIRWIYRISLIWLTFFVIIYLLLTLVVVVKITKIFKGPLRLS